MGHKSQRIGEKIAEKALALSGMVAVFTTAAVLFILCQKTWDFFYAVDASRFFLDTVWTPLFASKRYGIWALVSGSLLVTFVAMATAAPLGLLSAIYLSDFAPAKVRGLIKPLLEILAGIPTVVYGYFALTLVTPALMAVIPGLNSFNALSPGLVMGLMLTPTISSLCEDALSKTPRELKEASISLGARKIDSIFFVSLPYARSSILAAIFLAFGRAIGETMIVSVAAGLKPNFTLDVREPIQTMTAYIVQVSMGDTPQGSLEYLTIFSVGAMLFLLTFLFHAASRVMVHKKLKGFKA
jgi:phosphate transport system permease protein